MTLREDSSDKNRGWLAWLDRCPVHRTSWSLENAGVAAWRNWWRETGTKEVRLASVTCHLGDSDELT